MATRNSTGASRATTCRPTSRRCAPVKPKLAAVSNPAEIPQRIAFSDGEFSLISGLLTLGSRLPVTRYDPEILGTRLGIDEEAKSLILEQLSNVSFSVTQTIKIIGKLLAGQDERRGYIENEEVRELGFALHGLTHICEAIEAASFQIRDAVATEVSHG